MRRALVLILILVVGYVLTRMLTPLWRVMDVHLPLDWLRADGPAWWCYGLVWVLLVLLFLPRTR